MLNSFLKRVHKHTAFLDIQSRFTIYWMVFLLSKRNKMTPTELKKQNIIKIWIILQRSNIRSKICYVCGKQVATSFESYISLPKAIWKSKQKSCGATLLTAGSLFVERQHENNFVWMIIEYHWGILHFKVSTSLQIQAIPTGILMKNDITIFLYSKQAVNALRWPM